MQHVNEKCSHSSSHHQASICAEDLHMETGGVPQHSIQHDGNVEYKGVVEKLCSHLMEQASGKKLIQV